MQRTKKEKIDRLRKEILCLQGLDVKQVDERPSVALGAVLKNMPGQVFPTGVIHEFLSPNPKASASTTGFMVALLSTLLKEDRCCIWVSTHCNIFPPALRRFGIAPDRIIFIDGTKEKEALWIIEEALKCKSVGVVIGEIRALDFTASRRLQLAVENSSVTGFIHRLYPRKIQPTACVARWRIQPVPSRSIDNLPGVGFPNWSVELLKIRNGRPGCWQLEWTGSAFRMTDEAVQEFSVPALKNSTA